MRPEDRREVQGVLPTLRPRFGCVRRSVRSPCRPTSRIPPIRRLPVFATPERQARRALSHAAKPRPGWDRGRQSCEERDFYRIPTDRRTRCATLSQAVPFPSISLSSVALLAARQFLHLADVERRCCRRVLCAQAPTRTAPLQNSRTLVAPVAVAQQPLVEFSGWQPRQFRLEVDRARHFLTRQRL